MATHAEPHPAAPGTLSPRLAARRLSPEPTDRDQVLERLRNLRRVLPVLAQEMAAARRQAARLRTDNRRLAEQVRQLRHELDAHEQRSR